MRADVILIPVHNRLPITQRCCETLIADGTSAWATILVIDDGSTDGTADFLRSMPPAFTILQGDGTWWWAGAVRRGMELALSRGAERIYWLNDDCQPPPGALAQLRDFVLSTGCVSWIETIAHDGWRYGGHRLRAWSVKSCTADELRSGAIDTFSGNCVCLPRRWIERVGLPNADRLPHGLADLDYGLRLKKAGATLKPLPEVLARNDAPAASSSQSWLRGDRPMLAIWQDFHSKRSFLHFPVWRYFALTHWGTIKGSLIFIAPYLRWLAIALAGRPIYRLLRRFSGNA